MAVKPKQLKKIKEHDKKKDSNQVDNNLQHLRKYFVNHNIAENSSKTTLKWL